MPKASLNELLKPGQSPYFGCYTAGLHGYSMEEVSLHCAAYGIPLRSKDVRSWEEGNFKARMKDELFQKELQRKRQTPGSLLDPVDSIVLPATQHSETWLPKEYLQRNERLEFSDLQKLPDGWRGCEKRFFPCTQDNRPMLQWGWKRDFTPNLMTRTDAEVLSPVRWVGQNMLYQTFIVMDIDGVGHGCVDKPVIQFGELFKDKTLCYEDPKKPGSFHLYFKTDRLVPVRHFPHAKLDLMGNAVNAAVYFKNKKGNGLPMLKLNENIWNAMMAYQSKRKEN